MPKPFTKNQGGGYVGMAENPGTPDGTKFLRDDGTWQPPPGAGGGASTADAFVTIGHPADLTAERALTSSTSNTVNDGGANGTVTVERAALTGDVTAGANANATTIANDAVTFAKMQNVTSDRLLGRDTAASGDVEEIAVGGGIEFTGAVGIQTSAFTGDVTKAAGGTAQTIPANQISNAMIRDSLALSVIGRSASSGGDPADIQAGASTDQVLRESGNVLGFGTIATAGIANDAVTNAKLANMAANSIKLNNTGGAADPIDGTVAQALALLGAFAGVTLQVFTTPGANTYTPTSGMKFCIAITTGAGGGGGGSDASTTTSDCGVGGGGGAGGTCIEAFSAATIGAGQTVTIGTGGTAGSNAGGNGTAGGNTTFGALHTANGGALGTGSGTSTVQQQDIAGGLGGVPTGGLINITGGGGVKGVGNAGGAATDAGVALGGEGGASFWGGGGRGGGASALGTTGADSEAGLAGLAFGAGGGGAADINVTAGAAGGAGANGVCLVIEFT